MEFNKENVVIFSTESSLYLAKKLALSVLGKDLLDTNVERHEFSDGEKYYRLNIGRGDLFGKTAIFVGSTNTDENLNELYRIGCALAGYGTRQRIFVIPFFGYSTMEREVKAGEVVTAKTIARQLSVIPNTGLGNTFLFLDLHVSGLVHYFEGNCLRYELYAENVLVEAIKDLNLPPDEIIFGSADLGRPKWVKSFADKFHCSIALVNKVRKGEKTHISHIIGDVRDKIVIIYDDMTRSGGSIIDAADAYMDNGAKEVYAVLSHFAGDSHVIGSLIMSPIKKVITTNSHPASQKVDNKFFDIRDVSSIFANTILKIL